MNSVNNEPKFTYRNTNAQSSIKTRFKPIEVASANKPDFNAQGVSTSGSCISFNTHNSFVQYDGEPDCPAGMNIIKAFEGNDSIVFNETYIVVGECTTALKIHALYDLTIIGDLKVQECVVNRSLTVVGTAEIANLTCNESFVCKGDLRSGTIHIGGDMIADSIECDELVCDGNVAIQKTININRNAQIEKTIVACEGIMGTGRFSATNAIANEYFSFNGEKKGKILELETDNGFLSVETITIEQVIELANRKLSEEYDRFPFGDCETIIKRLQDLGALETKDLLSLSEIGTLFSKLAEISCHERIGTIEDYLTVLAARRTLPSPMYTYEPIDSVGKVLLPKAQKKLGELAFNPTSVEEFSKVLSLAVQAENELSEDWNLLMDKVFESVGLKYSTVSSMINRNKSKESVRSETADTAEGNTNAEVQRRELEQVVTQTRKADFLAKKLIRLKGLLGLTEGDLECLALIGVRTCGDLVKLPESTLKIGLSKGALWAYQIRRARNITINELANIENNPQKR